MAKYFIVIRGHGSISALGSSKADITKSYASAESLTTGFATSMGEVPVAALSESVECKLADFTTPVDSLKGLDRSVRLACFASKQALELANWDTALPIGVFIGSSRGATDTWESLFSKFSKSPEKRLPARTSPTTTAGNLASSVARLFNLSGVHSSHSITCSTALHAVLNGIAWLKAGMIDRVLVGGAEAPLTKFTVAQMQALGIYSDTPEDSWPCRPFAINCEDNSFVLGEGAACFCLERVAESALATGDLIITGVGFDTELTESFTAISKKGVVFQNTMRTAIASGTEAVGAVVAHAPGTRLGDAAELAAINAVFPDIPPVISNKYLAGHTFGASGALSLELAMLLLQGMEFPQFPYRAKVAMKEGAKFIKGPVLVNATGFGGNAVSVLLERVK